MVLLRFRFPEGSLPEPEQLKERLEQRLGSRAERMFDELSVAGNEISFCSMKTTPLLYAAHACQELGASYVSLDGSIGRLLLPEWCDTPWIAHPLLKKVQIFFSRYRSKVVPG